MSINIRTNSPHTMRSLSEHGSFRNSMYNREEGKNRKKTDKEPLKAVQNDMTENFNNNNKIRMKSAGLHNEISLIEEEISIGQTVEKALTSTEESLMQMQELVDLIGKETEYNTNLRKADQIELANLIGRINKIAEETSYGKNFLLDGSHGVRGVANGKYLEFVGMNPNSKGSPLSGYEVKIFKVGTRSELKGNISLTQEIIDEEEILVFEIKGITKIFSCKKGESVSKTFSRLSEWIFKNQIPIEIVKNPDHVLHFKHLQYGSIHNFGISSITPGLISSESKKIVFSRPGEDIQGEINGIRCLGNGQFLSSPEDEEEISKLTVRYTGHEVPKDKIAGIVSVSQNGIQFYTGNSESFVEKLSLKSIFASDLGKETENVSGFKSLQEIDIKSEQMVKDSLCVITKSLSEVSDVKAKVEFICGKTLKNNIQNLQQEHNKIVDSKYNIQNSGNARAFAELTKNQIKENSGRSTIAQAHQNPNAVLTLLK